MRRDSQEYQTKKQENFDYARQNRSKTLLPDIFPDRFKNKGEYQEWQRDLQNEIRQAVRGAALGEIEVAHRLPMKEGLGLDLHGVQAHLARPLVANFIEKSPGKSLTFIHGDGERVLSNVVFNAAGAAQASAQYQIDSRGRENQGATIVEVPQRDKSNTPTSIAKSLAHLTTWKAVTEDPVFKGAGYKTGLTASFTDNTCRDVERELSAPLLTLDQVNGIEAKLKETKGFRGKTTTDELRVEWNNQRIAAVKAALSLAADRASASSAPAVPVTPQPSRTQSRSMSPPEVPTTPTKASKEKEPLHATPASAPVGSPALQNQSLTQQDGLAFSTPVKAVPRVRASPIPPNSPPNSKPTPSPDAKLLNAGAPPFVPSWAQSAPVQNQSPRSPVKIRQPNFG